MQNRKGIFNVRKKALINLTLYIFIGKSVGLFFKCMSLHVEKIQNTVSETLLRLCFWIETSLILLLLVELILKLDKVDIDR